MCGTDAMYVMIKAMILRITYSLAVQPFELSELPFGIIRMIIYRFSSNQASRICRT